MTKSTGIAANPEYRRERAAKAGKAGHTVDAYVKQVLARAPELTEAHRQQLREMLQPFATHAGDGSAA